MARRLLKAFVMPHSFPQIIAVSLVALLAFPLPAFAGPKPAARSKIIEAPSDGANPRVLVVAPVADGELDDESARIANTVGLALAQTTPHHVVDSKLTARIIDYNDAGNSPSSELAGAQKEMSEAKEKFFSFHYADAAAKIDRAILSLKKIDDLSATGASLVDANLSRALIAKSRGDENAVKDAIASVLRVDPTFEISPQDYPPSLVATFNNVKQAFAAAPSGTIAVATTPPAADVYLNGIKKGVSPLEIRGLPEGSYKLGIDAARYEKLTRAVDVRSDARVDVKEKLKWAKNSAGRNDGENKPSDESAAEVKEGIRIAKLVRADMAVLIDADVSANGEKSIRARVVDAAFGAGMPPVVLPLGVKDSEGSWRSEGLAMLVEKIHSQTSVNLASHPSKKIDPKGVADPVLLAKHRRDVTKSPIFWCVVGALAAGAIGGGVAAAMGDGGSGGPGSVRVEFR